MCIILYNSLQAEDFEAYLHWMPDDTQVDKQLSDTPTGKLRPVKRNGYQRSILRAGETGSLEAHDGKKVILLEGEKDYNNFAEVEHSQPGMLAISRPEGCKLRRVTKSASATSTFPFHPV